MQAGLLTEPIEIYKQETAKTEYGAASTTYVLRRATKAQVINQGGSRGEENHQIFYDYSKTFVVRYYVEVEDTDHILYEGHWYRVLNIDEQRKYNNKSIQAERIQGNEQ